MVLCPGDEVSGLSASAWINEVSMHAHYIDTAKSLADAPGGVLQNNYFRSVEAGCLRTVR